jgi:hypothetical protein
LAPLAQIKWYLKMSKFSNFLFFSKKKKSEENYRIFWNILKHSSFQKWKSSKK